MLLFQSLALPFYVDFGFELPELLKLHGPCSSVWRGRYVKESRSIEDVVLMIKFYGIRPYYLTLLQYRGGSGFKFQIYNPYTIEKTYRNESDGSSSEIVCTNVDIDRLSYIYSFITMDSVIADHILVVESRHVVRQKYEVIRTYFLCHIFGLVFVI